MCGRFAFYSPHESVVRLFGLENAPEIEPHYNIAPTQYVAAVRAGHDGSRRLAMFHWGLVPWWAREKTIGARLINARDHTLAEKPAFRDAYRRRRCLVLANGYYEWQRSGTVKQPYLIGLESGEPFAMAGLWESWRDPAGGEPLESCTIVTTAPAQAIAHLHDRMPVILPRSAYTEWLDPELQDTRQLDRLLVACAEPLSSHAVSRRVNSARNDDPSLVEPVVAETA